jgi:hypothetical protein
MGIMDEIHRRSEEHYRQMAEKKAAIDAAKAKEVDLVITEPSQTQMSYPPGYRQIKAIETRYKGYRFRSRTETRWAVFFDSLGIKWEYEKEGYELSCGRYLPDFWLTEWEIWCEVKGKTATMDEIAKCQELRNKSSHAVLCLESPISKGPYSLYAFDTTDSGGGSSDWAIEWGHDQDGCADIYVVDHLRSDRQIWRSENFDNECLSIAECYGDSCILRAITAARSARFEFNERSR